MGPRLFLDIERLLAEFADADLVAVRARAHAPVRLLVPRVERRLACLARRLAAVRAARRAGRRATQWAVVRLVVALPLAVVARTVRRGGAVHPIRGAGRVRARWLRWLYVNTT